MKKEEEEHFPKLTFFKSILSHKKWRGELLFKIDTIDGYTYQPCNCSGRICIARGRWHFGDFRNIFLPSIDEDQKKSLNI